MTCKLRVCWIVVTSPPGQSGRPRPTTDVLCSNVFPSSFLRPVRPFVTFVKYEQRHRRRTDGQTDRQTDGQTDGSTDLKTNRFWCQLTQVVYGVIVWNKQLLGSGGQKSRSRGAEIGLGHTNPGRDISRTDYPTKFNEASCHCQAHITINANIIVSQLGCNRSKFNVTPSHEDEVGFGGLAEASFATSLSLVAFLYIVCDQ